MNRVSLHIYTAIIQFPLRSDYKVHTHCVYMAIKEVEVWKFVGSLFLGPVTLEAVLNTILA